MKTTRSRKRGWPRIVTVGRESVTIYKRTLPNGSTGFQVVNYAECDASGKRKRRLDSYATEADAIDAATKLARQMSEREVLAAAMTNEQASEYAAAVQKLAPFGIGLLSAADAVADTLRIIGGFKDMDAVKTAAAQGKPLPDLANVREAGKFYRSRHKTVTAKTVADVVAELIAIKKARGASLRYVQDLQNRLARFAEAFRKDAGSVTTADIMAWFDSQKFSPQNFMGFRRVIHLLFEFAVARGYAADNPAAALERVKVKHGATQVFTPPEIVRLLAAASPDFLPALAIGAFAGLRSAEIERLEWSDVNLKERFIVIGADKSKTASRRIVPVADNLAEWLTPYAAKRGKVWPGGHDDFYDQQQDAAKAAGLKWKANALRHSAASYWFAGCNDAGRVAGYLGNSAAVIHRHYRELVRPADAVKWFSIMPEKPANVLPMRAAVVAQK